MNLTRAPSGVNLPRLEVIMSRRQWRPPLKHREEVGPPVSKPHGHGDGQESLYGGTQSWRKANCSLAMSRCWPSPIAPAIPHPVESALSHCACGRLGTVPAALPRAIQWSRYLAQPLRMLSPALAGTYHPRGYRHRE